MPNENTPAARSAEPPTAPMLSPADPTTHAHAEHARKADILRSMRSSDVEPYTGLRYLSKLFRLMAILLVLVLLEELATGFFRFGMSAIPTLLGEVTRLVVAAGLLWGVGDLALLLIDVGHDVRAARILLARQVAHQVDEHHANVTAVTPAPRAPASSAPGGANGAG